MRKATVKIKSIRDLKAFPYIASKHDFDIDLAHGRYIIDGKSLMGILSLDLSLPIAMTIHTDDEDAALRFIDELRCFGIEVVTDECA